MIYSVEIFFTSISSQITDDLKVVATTREQRQKIRAHELLERKELLAQVNMQLVYYISEQHLDFHFKRALSLLLR